MSFTGPVGPAGWQKCFKSKAPKPDPKLPPHITSFVNCDGEGDRVVINFSTSLSREKRDRFVDTLLARNQRYIRGVRWQQDNRVRITVWKSCSVDARLDAPKLASDLFVELFNEE